MNSNEFSTHPIFYKIEQFESLLLQNDFINSIELEKISFFDAAIKFIADRLKHTIPVLINITELTTIAQEVENTFNQINNFIGNKNIGHITNAEAHLNAAIQRVRNLPVPFSKGDYNFSKSIAAFAEIVISKQTDIEKNYDALNSQLQNLKGELIEKQIQINQLTESINSKSIEISNLSTVFQSDYDLMKSAYTTTLEADRKNYRTEITTDRTNNEDEFNLFITNNRNNFEEQYRNINSKTDNILIEISSKLEEARKLVNVIGNVGVTGNYQKIALEHKKTANVWRIVSISFMLVMSGLLIWSIWDIKTENYDWIKSVIRIVAAGILSYPATYAARESSRHRKLEIVNRKLELELASLTPFIELLPDVEKIKIKGELVKRYFGSNIDYSESSNESKSDEEISLGGLEKIFKALFPLVKK